MANPDHSKGIKSEKFTGTYFKRWVNQMKYWLTTLGLISAIDSSIPAPSPKTSSDGASPTELVASPATPATSLADAGS